VAPAGTSALTDISYHYLTKPAFVQDYQWGKIGLPSTMNAATVPATDRYEANDIFAGACGTEDFYAGMLEQELLGIYPNPAVVYLTVSNSEENSSYRIYDLQGRVWQQGMLDSTNSIGLSSLPKGLYILSIANTTTRFIKSE
jgi:hypothetical protein